MSGMLDDQKAFLAQERERQRKFVAKFCALGAAYLCTFLFVAPDVNNVTAVSKILNSCLIMGTTILLFYFVTKTKYYLKIRYIEVPFLFLIYLSQVNLIYAVHPLILMSGSTLHNILAMDTSILIFVFSIVCISDSKSYSFLAISISLACFLGLKYLGVTNLQLIGYFAPIVISTSSSIYANMTINNVRWSDFLHAKELVNERKNTEKLLYNVLPEMVAQRIQKGETIADSFSEVSIIFIDIVGFSKMSTRLTPKHLLDILNRFFVEADACAEEHGVEKVKTIGDAYLAVVGAQIPHDNPADTAVNFSKSMLLRVEELSSKLKYPISVRIGIHSGSVIGGVIGEFRKTYDFWGESMNIASRIQTCADPDTILVSESTYLRTNDIFLFEEPVLAMLKGLGEAKVYKVIA